jgi:hypothetical protein
MDRVAHALGTDVPEQWYSPLHDLIAILGDANANENEEQEMQTRIIELRLFYDWPVLKSAVRICPAATSEEFKINDLWNVLDMHIPLEFGFRAPAERDGEQVGIPSKERFYRRKEAHRREEGASSDS